MNAGLQERISPATPPAAQNFSDAEVRKQSEAQDANGGADRTDFRTLLTNSNDETKKKREAQKRGDFSDAKTEEEFLQELAEQSKPKREIHNTLNKDDFLKLFVEQLKHQDPMNPDDGAEMASKLAQFNSLEQMMNVNTSLNKMLEGQNTDRSLQLVNYVGKEISLDGGRLKVADGKPGDATFALEGAAQKVTVQVRDGAGITVREMEMGALPTGTHAVNWDGMDKKGGRAADGVYSYFVSAKTVDGKDVPVKTNTKARITGVDVKDQKGIVYTDFGKVKLDEISSVGFSGFQDVAFAGVPAAGKAAPGGPRPSTTEELERMRAAGTLGLGADEAGKQVAAGQGTSEGGKADDGRAGGDAQPGGTEAGKAASGVNAADAGRTGDGKAAVNAGGERAGATAAAGKAPGQAGAANGGSATGTGTDVANAAKPATNPPGQGGLSADARPAGAAPAKETDRKAEASAAKPSDKADGSSPRAATPQA